MAPPPGTVAPGPTAPVDPEAVERLLSRVERAWEVAEMAVLRGRRCGASETEKDEARRAGTCLETFTKSAGSLSAASAELCAAKSQGRAARLSAVQAQALEALAVCLSDGVPGATPASPGWLRALVGTGIPAAAAVLVAI